MIPKSVRIFTLSTITLVLLLINSACKKDPIQYTFKGTLTDQLGGAPVPNVQVKISQLEFTSTSTNANFTTVASLNTNSSGYYESTFDRVKVSDFKIELNKSGYFIQENLINPADVSTEEDNTFDFVLEPQSWIHFQFTNFLPVSSDQLTLILLNFKENCSGCAPDDYLYFPGEVDTNLYFTTTAGEYVKFIYIDEESGNSNSDSVYATPFDTVSYSFNY